MDSTHKYNAFATQGPGELARPQHLALLKLSVAWINDHLHVFFKTLTLHIFKSLSNTWTTKPVFIR